jgi:hypothetical protein
MSRSISKVEREGVINSLVRNKRKDDFSKRIMDEMGEWSQKNSKHEEVVHTVNSWDLPHSFMAFSVTIVPALVTCRKGRIRVETYFPKVLRYFSN